MVPSRDPRTFRLTPVGTVLNFLATCVLTVPGVILLWGWPTEPLAVMFGGWFAACGVYLGARVFALRVQYDEQEVVVAGPLLTRRVQRSRIVDVGRDIESPNLLSWNARGRLTVTPLAVLKTRNSVLLPREARRRRVDYLDMLGLWARGVSFDEARARLDDRYRSRIEAPRPGSRRGWRMANRVRVRRADAITEVGEVTLPLMSTLLIVAALGIARRGPAVPLEVSSVLVAIASGVIAVVTVAVVIRRIRLRAPDPLPRGPFIWPVVGCAIGGVILVIRSSLHAQGHGEVAWGLGGCLLGILTSSTVFAKARRVVARRDRETTSP